MQELAHVASRVPLPDLQNQPDLRDVPIDRVGIENFKCPLRVLDRAEGHQIINATVNLYTNLPGLRRGSNMSRFVQVIDRHLAEVISVDHMHSLLEEVRQTHGAASALVEISFDYFIRKAAPVSRHQAYNWYPACLISQSSDEGTHVLVEVTVPFLSLCPCSKEISRYGAHNQRSYVSVLVELLDFVWIEEIIDIVEQSASCEIFNILKREDERYVTEKSYETPRFVEDMVREIVLQLRQEEDRIGSYRVYCVHQESIHQHNAVAVIEGDNRDSNAPSLNGYSRRLWMTRSPLIHLRHIV